jgi:hypothetical protein
MGYFYNCGEADAAVTMGANNTVVCSGIIQKNDGYGGRNFAFSVSGQLAVYHVHFNGAEGYKVNVVRYKATSATEGDNVIKWSDTGGTGSQRDNLGGLANSCQSGGYPKHAALLNNLKSALNSWVTK